MENEASELKMASLKMILVQCGQLPMLLSIVVFPEVVCCQPDVGSRSDWQQRHQRQRTVRVPFGLRPQISSIMVN